MKNIAQLLVCYGILIYCLVSCSPEFKGYKKLKSNTYYKFYTKTDSTRVNVGDEINVKLRYTLNDSVIFNTDNSPQSKRILPASNYPGDLFDCISMMSVGDSAIFILDADSVFLITFRQPTLPLFVKPKSKLNIEIKILSMRSKEELAIEKEKELLKLQEKEIEDIKKFSNENNIHSEFIENTGIYYKTIKKGTGDFPKPTDFIKIKYIIQDLNQQTIFSTEKMENEVAIEQLSANNNETNGFKMIIQRMRKGQKANFIVPSKYLYKEEGVPGRILPYTPFFYTIEIIDIMKEDNYLAKEKAKNQIFIDAENNKIATFIKKNNIQEKPRESGLYFIEKEKGEGKQVKKGDKVKVHYILYNLDGKKISSSIDSNVPFIFVVGRNQVIEGWEEALTLMREGGKATLIIPSKIAYKEKKRSADILPYTPLHFEVELLEIME